MNSHNTRKGELAGAADAHTGTMTSEPFNIERRFIHALVCGGDSRKLSLRLLIDGKEVARVSGKEQSNEDQKLDVTKYQGQSARLQIVDHDTGSWGNIGVDHITFSDRPLSKPKPLEVLPDYGEMTRGAE